VATKIEKGEVTISTTWGTSLLLAPRGDSDEGVSDAAESAELGGQIYTDVKDMPSLEALLADYQIATAVIWKDPRAWPHDPMRIVGASAAAAAITAIGAALLAVDLAAAAHPNPYISLLLFLGGLGLLATILAALRAET
jgi:hypothetical protein